MRPARAPCDRVGRRTSGQPWWETPLHKLHQGKHRLSQLDLITEHQHHVVAAPDAKRLEVRRDLVGAMRHIVIGPRRRSAISFDDDQSRAIIASRDRVEPVSRPAEPVAQLRPLELLLGPGAVPVTGAAGLAPLGTARSRSSSLPPWRLQPPSPIPSSIGNRTEIRHCTAVQPCRDRTNGRATGRFSPMLSCSPRVSAGRPEVAFWRAHSPRRGWPGCVAESL